MTEDDATVRLPARQAAAPGAAAPPRGGGGPRAALIGAALLAAGIAIALAVAVGAAWYMFGRQAPPEPPPKPEASAAMAPPSMPAPSLPAPTPPVVPVPAPAIGPPIATEDEILAHQARAPTVFRLAENPHVFIIDFPSLASQGAALNRVAALVEKVGQPRDRVLDDAALARAIAANGDTPDTYYYGHNYRGRDVERFFALADRDGIALTPEETWLRGEVARLRRLLPPSEDFAMISVPGLGPRVDATMRRAILHHEIGHGHFFTNARFAAHVARVWREVFTEAERASFRAFLEREGYDPALEEVMMNEAMAYLLFTPDARFFSPSHAGLTDARAAEIAAALRAGAPR
ncbi:hypothetical protein GXW74_26565 [Roseomonas eburnea]|uniref:Uncharacterized protein n=1 Tax=Neoroseomonas eburnea TaxID=1346889 RepID=A0A9X9XK21_9PROT|nr:hypothetical protein [Neoroseomonas eburnea]MBR0684057.1 hypothetical protein [Neoroseomonas eburnea]